MSKDATSAWHWKRSGTSLIETYNYCLFQLISGRTYPWILWRDCQYQLHSFLKTRSHKTIFCRPFFTHALFYLQRQPLYPVFQGPASGRATVSLMYSLSKTGLYMHRLRPYMTSTGLRSVSRRTRYPSLHRRLGTIFIVISLTASGATAYYYMDCSDKTRCLVPAMRITRVFAEL